jgi:hypothetical protein
MFGKLATMLSVITALLVESMSRERPFRTTLEGSALPSTITFAKLYDKTPSVHGAVAGVTVNESNEIV